MLHAYLATCRCLAYYDVAAICHALVCNCRHAMLSNGSQICSNCHTQDGKLSYDEVMEEFDVLMDSPITDFGHSVHEEL